MAPGVDEVVVGEVPDVLFGGVGVPSLDSIWWDSAELSGGAGGKLRLEIIR